MCVCTSVHACKHVLCLYVCVCMCAGDGGGGAEKVRFHSTGHGQHRTNGKMNSYLKMEYSVGSH